MGRHSRSLAHLFTLADPRRYRVHLVTVVHTPWGPRTFGMARWLPCHPSLQVGAVLTLPDGPGEWVVTAVSANPYSGADDGRRNYIGQHGLGEPGPAVGPCELEEELKEEEKEEPQLEPREPAALDAPAPRPHLVDYKPLTGHLQGGRGPDGLRPRQQHRPLSPEQKVAFRAKIQVAVAKRKAAGLGWGRQGAEVQAMEMMDRDAALREP